MSTQPDLLDALRARLGAPAAALAVDVFAAWAGGTADMIAAGGCSCPENHDAHAAHFGHIGMVLRNVYDAKPLTEDTETPIVLPQPVAAYISGDGDGYLYLRCDRCVDRIAPVEAGDGLAGLNAEAAEHTCPTGEADTR